MKGLEGYADANKDKNITNGEFAYMDENVSQKAPRAWTSTKSISYRGS